MANKSNPASQSISVPHGGGALQGIGETFSPDPHTGTGNFTVPIAVPPGRNGFQPQLSLAYSTGSGNGPYGLGWSFTIPAISRKTSKGIPRYQADGSSQESDTFLLSEELIQVGSTGDVTRYRPRTEGLFGRIERHTTPATDHWEVRSRDGLLSVYGTPLARSDDPATIANPDRRTDVFSWKLTKTVDPFGNTIEYEYERDAGDTADHHWDQLYLKRIRYADFAQPGDGGRIDFLASVTFVYDGRPDPFSDHRAGFELRTRRRCTRIEIRTHADRERLVRVCRLIYLDQRGLPIEQTPSNGTSLLSQVQVEGCDGDLRESLPPLEFGYTAFEPTERRYQPLGAGGSRPDRSLGHPDVELIDLFANGLPTIVEVNEQVRYWRNRGEGGFDLVRTMQTAPGSVRLSEPGVQLLDADGNGRSDLMVVDGHRTGYYPLTSSGEWHEKGFVRYRTAPSVNLDAPDVRLLDLDGDGVTDALRTGPKFELYYNDPDEGWTTVELRDRVDADDFPNVSFDDPRVRLADLTGDGLQDILRVHDGSIEYWPYRGYGRWGRRVVMRNAPRFEDAAFFPGVGFDPRRLLVGDVDGDGVADLVYVSSGHVSIWINQHGNGWSDPIVVHGTPPVTDATAVRLADMLGHGTEGILWTYDFGAFPDSTYKFLDLTGGIKPYLLDRMDNQMGAVTRIAYAPSTRFYLEDDARAETRWRTPLPFPVQVVARVEIIDRISRGTLTTEYRYHHGYWDGTEREFRGFGMVEQIDTETFTDHRARAARGPDARVEPVPEKHFSPPLLTRTWFHQGPVDDDRGDGQEPDWSMDYWPEDPPALAHAEAINRFLHTLADPRDRRDALRTLRGSTLRTELYALDGTDRQGRPYTVTEHAYGLREESAPEPGDPPRRRIFFPHPVAARTTQWERGDEPMTQFAFTDDYDAHGQPRRQVSLAVPRHRDYRAPAEPGAPYLGTLVESRYAERDDAQRHIVNRVCESAHFEIPNDGSLPVRDLYRAIQSGRTARTLFCQSFNYYDGEPFVGLPYGEVGDFGALVRTESLVLTEEMLRDVYRDPADPDAPDSPPYLRVDGVTSWPDEYPKAFQDETPSLAGYVFADGSDHRSRGYFAQATRVAFDFQTPGLPARGLAVTRRDPLGNDTAIVFDQPYHLLPVQLTDAAGLTTSAEYDYRVLQARTVTDANGNRTAVRFGPLGLVTASAVMGKTSELVGDTLETPGSRLEYDLFAFADRQQPVFVRHVAREHHVTDTDVPLPARDATIVTVEYSDGFGRLLQTRTQTDDVLYGAPPFGVDVLPADQSAPSAGVVRGRQAAADVPNVIVSGWQVHDNKGRAVEVYEPFFSTGLDYQPALEEELGRKTTTSYDPRGEAIRTVGPDGSEHRVIHGIPLDLSNPDEFTPTPWVAYSYDANDLATVSRGPDGSPLTTAAPATHHFTPSSILVDALGRTVLAVARTREAVEVPDGPLPAIEELHTTTTYDIRSNVLTVTDPLKHVAFSYRYDLADRPWRIESLDGGVRRIVVNAVDAEVERRDSKGALILQAYDRLQRPTRTWARDDAGSRVTLHQRLEYGDGSTPEQAGPEREAMRDRNLLGQLTRHHDEAGLTTVSRVDFKGNVLDKSRQVIADEPILAVFEQAPAEAWRVAPFQVDWQTRPGQTLADRERELLEASAYRTTPSYDALNRVTRMQLPEDVDGRRRELRPEYDRGGSLKQLSLDDTVYIERIAYDAGGRRTLIAYGNGVLTRYAYDARTSRLTRLRSERYTRPDAISYHPSGEVLQDFGYDYDLAGNLLAIRDRTPGSGFRNNPEAATTMDPVLAQLLASGNALNRRFEYDPLYRLLAATGRECERLPERAPWDDRPRCTDLTKARAYTERYAYDAAGNTVRLEHRNDTGGFRRTFAVEPGSNRVHRVDTGDLEIDYTFDANGNMRSETTSRHFEWDHLDQLKTFRTQTDGAEPSVHAHYLYGAAGGRVKKLVRRQGGGVEVTHYVDGLFEHHRWRSPQGDGQNSQVHVTDGTQRLALVRTGMAYPDDRGPAVQFILADHLGSGNVVVDAAGAGVDREEFTPYGESSFGSFARKRYRFTGCERDEESGLAYHTNRYYAAGLTRWASCDPLGMDGGLNPYTYASDNPLGLVDTSGTQPAGLSQDAEGNYIVPGEVIRIHGTAPAVDELEIQKRGGASHYDSRAEVERQLRFRHSTNTSDYSWLKPPPGPDWDAEGLPELAEEARAEAEAKWDAYVTKEYQTPRDAKVVELAKQQRRISSANTAGQIIGGVTLVATVVVGGAAAGAGTGLSALKARGTVFLGQQLVNSTATALTGSIVYGVAAPPGAPNLPGPGDDGGRAARGLVSRLAHTISTRTRGQREVIAKPTLKQVKAMRPWFTTFQDWGGMIWGGGRTGALDLMHRRTAAELRQIPNLTVEAAMTLRNWLSQLPTGAGGQAPGHRIKLLDHIIDLLRGG
jgi:RHS repeat-associated protein